MQYTCPKCGTIGVCDGYVPLCHSCDYKVKMEPSINGVIVKENTKKGKAINYQMTKDIGVSRSQSNENYKSRI